MNLKAYLQIFSTSWQNELVYRANFILWRLRNILRILMVIFLWSGIFQNNTQILSYTKADMFTYVFLALVIQSVIFSSPSADHIGGEIASGALSNYLLKPLSYLKYWFTRDLSSKLLNISFAFFEISLLYFWLKPPIHVPSDPIFLSLFTLNIIIASVSYFFLSVLARFTAFWSPENTWGLSFLVLVFTEILSGWIFPLDLLPSVVYTAIQLTPFPYLIYFPLKILLGKYSVLQAVQITAQSFTTLTVLLVLVKVVWRKGLKNYSADGR